MTTDTPDPYEQLPPGLRSAIEGSPHEVRMREAAANGLIPEGFSLHVLQHTLGMPDALSNEDQQLLDWLKAPPEVSN